MVAVVVGQAQQEWIAALFQIVLAMVVMERLLQFLVHRQPTPVVVVVDAMVVVQAGDQVVQVVAAMVVLVGLEV